jgi:CheY-like chemotaxis protein
VAKILVVDADEDARGLIVFALRFAGHQLKSASSAEECIDQARQFKPELILLDASLPGVGGIMLNASLKSNLTTAGIPVVLLVSNSEQINLTAEQKDDIYDFLLKSLPTDQLTDSVNALLRKLRK